MMERRSHRFFLMSQLFILTLVTLGTLFHVMSVTSSDREEYRELMHPVNQSGVPIEYQSKQYRQDICRDIYTNKLQTRLVAAQGVMVYIQDTQKPGFVEELMQVECWMQEEIQEGPDGPIQVVRHIMAEQACFDYRTNTLTAEAVSFERYLLSDKKLSFETGDPLMTGQAASAVMTFSEGKPTFEAKRLKLQIPGKMT
jgi:hypothetical protein